MIENCQISPYCNICIKLILQVRLEKLLCECNISIVVYVLLVVGVGAEFVLLRGYCQLLVHVLCFWTVYGSLFLDSLYIYFVYCTGVCIS